MNVRIVKLFPNDLFSSTYIVFNAIKDVIPIIARCVFITPVKLVQ